MIDQSNSAAERSAHVHRGDAPSPTDWPVVRMPDGTWKLKSIVALEARIAELEDELSIWRSVFPDIAPERVLPDRRLLLNRITKLEAALSDVLPTVDTCNSWHREAQAKGYAALKGGEDE